MRMTNEVNDASVGDGWLRLPRLQQQHRLVRADRLGAGTGSGQTRNKIKYSFISNGTQSYLFYCFIDMKLSACISLEFYFF